MSDISCAICPFWTNNYCHHVSNATDSAVSPTWWCSEHPLAPGQRDRIAEMARMLRAGALVSSVTRISSHQTAPGVKPSASRTSTPRVFSGTGVM